MLQENNYLIRKNIFGLVGSTLKVYNEAGDLTLVCRKKGFKLKEDIRIYSDEERKNEVLRIAARNVIDFSATYDVFDSTSNEKLGSLRRKGLKSILKDEWLILDTADSEIGVIKEDSRILALLRRFLTSLIPQKFHAFMDGQEVASFQQNFNPFVAKIAVNFSSDTDKNLDRRLGLAAGLLLNILEERS